MNEPSHRPHGRILETVARYYSDRLDEFGPNFRGVDWNSQASQTLRFTKLLTMIEPGAGDSLNDYGCGYGALLAHIRTTGSAVEYCGYDVSEAMIRAARTLHEDDPRARFTSDPAAVPRAAYTVASGIFNVKLTYATEEWREYVERTLDAIAALSERGFAFNMLTTYSDPHKRRDGLFYADPREMFDLCRGRFSPRVALLHDYPLYEFSIIVRT